MEGERERQREMHLYCTHTYVRVFLTPCYPHTQLVSMCVHVSVCVCMHAYAPPLDFLL